MMRLLAAAAIVLSPLMARAQPIYRWVDDAGVTNYTDDPNGAPGHAAVTTTSGEDLSVLSIHGDDARPKPVVDSTTMARPSASASASAGTEGSTDGEEKWRKLFRDAREKIRALEDEIALDEKKVANPGGLPSSAPMNCTWVYTPQPRGARRGGRPTQVCVPYLNAEYQRIQDSLELNRQALKRAKEEFADLERRAAFASVPFEWRR